jgi:hypothetical protein
VWLDSPECIGSFSESSLQTESSPSVASPSLSDSCTSPSHSLHSGQVGIAGSGTGVTFGYSKEQQIYEAAAARTLSALALTKPESGSHNIESLLELEELRLSLGEKLSDAIAASASRAAGLSADQRKASLVKLRFIV